MGKTFACMNIAVIGNCKKTSNLAEKLAEAGHDVSIALVDGVEDEIFLPGEPENICFDSIEAAASDADVIFLSIPCERVREVAYLLGDVRNKVIIDMSGNIDPKPADYVYTLKAARSITGSLHIVKAYHFSHVFEKDGKDLLFAGDCVKAKAVARILANDIGYMDTHDFGGHESLPVLEEMVRFWHNLADKQEAVKKIGLKITMK